MAKSVSVAVGESETMRAGRLETVTLPFEPIDGDRERRRGGRAAGRTGDGDGECSNGRSGE